MRLPADATAVPKELVLGIFVGGQSLRMGRVPKGLLAAPSGQGETLVERAVGLALALSAEPVLVGHNEAYRHLGLSVVADGVADAGPLGGLVGLMRARAGKTLLVLACDMPFVPLTLLRDLAERLVPGVPAVVPSRSGGLEPLCAAYCPELCLEEAERALGQGRRGMRQFVRGLRALELPLEGDQEHWLDDWDSPADM